MYRTRFLQRWTSPYTPIYSLLPIAESRLVTPPMLPLDHELSQAKLAIDTFHHFERDKEKYYDQATRLIDPFFHFKKIAKQHVYPEETMTNAWLKCWEMIHVFRLLPETGHVRLFCNAELPGAFLFAINHFIYTKSKATFEWKANSLYPSDGGLGDEFGLYRRYPKHWCMSKEHNGSVTDPAMIERLAKMCPHTITLYTSDIGIALDHTSFLKQEEIEAPLHLGQVICGLRMLQEGGHLICKTFMFFSPFSISLMYLTSQCFTEFFITKPETSRPGNSEVYIIGKGFRIREEIIQLLMNTLTTWNPDKMSTYLVPVPEDFYLSIFLALHKIYRRQIHFIYKQIQTVKDLYESGVPPTVQYVRTTELYQSEQQRLEIWKRYFYIPYLEKKYSL